VNPNRSNHHGFKLPNHFLCSSHHNHGSCKFQSTITVHHPNSTITLPFHSLPSPQAKIRASIHTCNKHSKPNHQNRNHTVLYLNSTYHHSINHLSAFTNKARTPCQLNHHQTSSSIHSSSHNTTHLTTEASSDLNPLHPQAQAPAHATATSSVSPSSPPHRRFSPASSMPRNPEPLLDVQSLPQSP
jgi:hypothetical protein